MATTPTLETTHAALQGMDKTFEMAEAHLRVLQSIDHPAAIKMADDLAKAKRNRTDLLNAIQTEMNR